MSTKFACLALVFCVSLQFLQIQSAKLDGNGYTLTVAVSEDFIASVEDEVTFTDSLKDVLSRASAALFRATDYKVYFKNVDVLLPRTWVTVGTSTWTVNYLNADVRIEDTITDAETPVYAPRVRHSKPCGYSGEYIITSPQFFSDDNQIVSSKYGDLAKVFLHEWAHYRYGVFEEYGYSGDSQFPYSYVNIDGQRQVTGCNDTEIPGVLAARPEATEDECTLDNNNCRFRPDLAANFGPSTSLMFMQFLPQATQFCDSKSHNPMAPNQHNFRCRNRSIKTVISRHPDFEQVQPLTNNTDTTPIFRFLKPAPPAVYIVMDTSTHTNSTADFENFFALTKSKINGLLGNLARTVPVTIVKMSGSTYNSSRVLGGYATSVIGPVQTETALNELRVAVNNMRREGDGLLLDRALMGVADLVTPYTHVSGSIILLIKYSQATDFSFRPMESEVISMLNARNSRLVAVEFGRNPEDFNLERITSPLFMDGAYQKVTDIAEASNALDTAMGAVVSLTSNGGKLRSRRTFIGWDEVTLSTNVTGAHPSDVRPTNTLVVNIHIPSTVNDEELTFKFFTTNGNPIYDSNSPGNWNVSREKDFTSWNEGKYRIYTFTFSAGNTFGQYRYELSYKGSDTATAYIDAVQIGSTDPTIGGGGSPQQKPYNIEVFTSADKELGELNLGAPGEEPVFHIYTSIIKGLGLGGTTAAKAIVHDPNGNTSSLFLKDDGVYPDMTPKDGTYTGQYLPKVSGLHYVSIDAYRRVPDVPLQVSSAQFYLHALPIDQRIEFPYCNGESCAATTINTLYRRVLPFATKVNILNGRNYKPRPIRILDFKLDNIADDYSSATLSWTVPSNGVDGGSVDSYRLVYGPALSTVITENGVIPSSANAANSSDVLEGSLTPQAPNTSQTVTIRLNQFETYNPVYFTIASSSNSRESYPAPVVYAPRRSAPPDTTEGPSSTAASSTVTSTTLSSSLASTRTPASSTSTTTAAPGTSTSASISSISTETTTTAGVDQLLASASNLMIVLTVAILLT